MSLRQETSSCKCRYYKVIGVPNPSRDGFVMNEKFQTAANYQSAKTTILYI